MVGSFVIYGDGLHLFGGTEPKTISEKGTMCLLTIRENVLYKSRTRHKQRASVYQIQIKLSIIIVMKTTSIAAGAALLLTLPECCSDVLIPHVA